MNDNLQLVRTEISLEWDEKILISRNETPMVRRIKEDPDPDTLPALCLIRGLILATIGVVTPYRRIALQNLQENKNRNRASLVMRAPSNASGYESFKFKTTTLKLTGFLN